MPAVFLGPAWGVLGELSGIVGNSDGWMPVGPLGLSATPQRRGQRICIPNFQQAGAGYSYTLLISRS